MLLCQVISLNFVIKYFTPFHVKPSNISFIFYLQFTSIWASHISVISSHIWSEVAMTEMWETDTDTSVCLCCLWNPHPPMGIHCAWSPRALAKHLVAHCWAVQSSVFCQSIVCSHVWVCVCFRWSRPCQLREKWARWRARSARSGRNSWCAWTPRSPRPSWFLWASFLHPAVWSTSL